MLPTDMERAQIFFWLKKVSSATAWRRIFEFYRVWTVSAENSLRVADENGWAGKTAIPTSDYLLILKGLSHCEDGVIQLSKGDKRVFKFDANGKFAMARRILFHWAEMTTRIEQGENIIDENHTPFWIEFCETLTSACQAWQECAQHVLEPRYLDEPGLTLYGDWLRNELALLHFPENLPALPDPSDNVFIKTGDRIPCSGIWEPIDEKKTPLTRIFNRAVPPTRPFNPVGAMNYLHGGSKAPRITVETETDNIDFDTTWRLLWSDERYLDEEIPIEEKSYRFNEPKNNRK
ncbi:hypothetical protein IFU01_04790 [Oxalobacteraceae sp. CFBP 8763]|nr:hypothetical protein [Oxalobacteraceae sp. CFBP 8763]